MGGGVVRGAARAAKGNAPRPGAPRGRRARLLRARGVGGEEAPRGVRACAAGMRRSGQLARVGGGVFEAPSLQTAFFASRRASNAIRRGNRRNTSTAASGGGHAVCGRVCARVAILGTSDICGKREGTYMRPVT